MVPCSGISFIDSTAMQDCHNLRMRIHRTMAERGQTSTGWFFGFKLHLITNHRGEPMPITRVLQEAALEGWRTVCFDVERIKSICSAPYLQSRGVKTQAVLRPSLIDNDTRSWLEADAQHGHVDNWRCASTII